MLFALNFEKVGLVPSFLDVLLIVMLKLDVIFDLMFNKIVLICEGLFKEVDTVFFLLEIAVDPCIFVFIGFKFLL